MTSQRQKPGAEGATSSRFLDAGGPGAATEWSSTIKYRKLGNNLEVSAARVW